LGHTKDFKNGSLSVASLALTLSI